MAVSSDSDREQSLFDGSQVSSSFMGRLLSFFGGEGGGL